jgi:hypothetical protein
MGAVPSGTGDERDPLLPLRQRAPVEFACAVGVAIVLTCALMVKAWVLSARYDPGMGSGLVPSRTDYDVAARPLLPGLRPGWFMGRHNDLSDHQVCQPLFFFAPRGYCGSTSLSRCTSTPRSGGYIIGRTAPY